MAPYTFEIVYTLSVARYELCCSGKAVYLIIDSYEVIIHISLAAGIYSYQMLLSVRRIYAQYDTCMISIIFHSLHKKCLLPMMIL